jgi:hypothetical protein
LDQRTQNQTRHSILKTRHSNQSFVSFATMVLGFSCICTRASSQALSLSTRLRWKACTSNLLTAHDSSKSSSVSRRPLSSWRATTANSDDGGISASVDPEIVLYERGPGRNALARSGLGFSSFHTAYWVWYSADFIPTVNAAEMHDLHIDPMLGVVGIVFASVIQGIFFTYPKRLVSRLTWKSEARQLLFYSHSIPFVTPSTTPTIYTLGASPVLDPSSSDTKHLLDKLAGDISQYRGHMAVAKKGQWPPFLLDLRESSDVHQSELMLEALLSPDRMGGTVSDDAKRRGKVTPNNRRKESNLRKIVRRR